jgi:hypothetical protein
MVSILFGMHMAHKNIFSISSKTPFKINYAFGIKKKLYHSPISCSILATNWFTTPIASVISKILYIPFHT